MPMKRRGRRRFYRKRRFTKRAVATKAYVKKLVRKEAETKYWDLSTASQPYSIALGATTILDLTEVPQGTTDVTRVGDKLTIRGLDIRMDAIIADTTNVIRCIIFQWYINTNITLSNPLGSQVLQDITTYPHLSNYHHDNNNQFHILYDTMIQLGAQGPQARVWHVKPNLKWAKKTVEFSGGGTNGANKLYMLLVSDSSAVSHPTVRIQSRLRFDDS